MNKLVVVSKNEQTYFIKRLIEEVGQEQLAFFNPWKDILLPEGENYLVRTTGVYGSDLDLMMIQALPQSKVFNPLPVLKRFRSKSAQYSWLEENNFPCLPWLPLKGMELLNVEKFFRLYPHMVVKPLIGQGGWGVAAHTWESFKSWWKKKQGKDEDYLLQPLVKEAQELRYFFIRDEFSMVLERKSKSGIAANFRRQGEAVVSALPPQFRPEIARLIQQSGAYYGAIDLFIDDGALYILELNSVPGIEQLEQVSGLNIMKTLLTAKFFGQSL